MLILMLILTLKLMETLKVWTGTTCYEFDATRMMWNDGAFDFGSTKQMQMYWDLMLTMMYCGSLLTMRYCSRLCCTADSVVSAGSRLAFCGLCGLAARFVLLTMKLYC